MTKSIVELVRHLTDLSIDLETDGSRLRCHAPEGALTPILQQEIAKRKTEIILFLQQAKQVKASHQLPIPRVPRNDHLPLSFAQSRLWFLYQLEGASATYNMVGVLKLSGSLNVDALKQATGEILQRHEVLRTRFQQVDGIPVQVIDPNPIWNLPIVDLQQVSQPEAEAQRLASLEAQTPFDLSQSPLLRLTLLRLQPQEHLLLINIHHIVSDGWSNGIFIRELSILYAAFCMGEHSLGQSTPTPLPELPIQYADFAIWQRQWLRGDVLAAQLGYWKQQLAGAPPLLELPTDRPRPAVQTFKAGIKRFQLDSKLTDQIRKRSQESESTLFMTLLAGFVLLLFRYSGQTDLVVGSPIANRNRREIEGLIGFFVNTLALRFNLSQAPTFEALLAQVRQVTQEAYDHQDLPFEILVEQLQPERNLDRNPLVQVVFALQNAPADPWNLPGLKVEDIPWELDAVRVDLEVHLGETPSGIEGVCCYNKDLFDAATISRMMQHFENLLEGIVANPHKPVALLPLLTHQERHQLLVEWNDTFVDYPHNLSIHQLFESQVERTPDAVAVVYENQQLTYAELNTRANQLAHYLQSLGVGADVLVGICVERSLEMVIGLLGILKAGGAYLPLDPEYPTERLAFMLEDAAVLVLLTQQQLVEKLPPNQAQLICLDSNWQLISQLSRENPISFVQENNLGYVIYTSGSTGKPKGVAMNQLALCNLILWQLKNTTISSNRAKTLQFAPISFDVSFQEMFSTWCSGGTLLLIDSQLRREPLALLGLLQEQAVERVFLPFVALQQLAEVAVGSELVMTHLKEIITAGEQLQITPAISKWFGQLNGCTLHNHYGPSESHVVTSLTLSDSVESWALLPPIGRPIANTQIYILDECLQSVPVGVPGELYIGGVCLARGYFNRPELTQERFISNPFNNSKFQIPNSKLYKTGDLARYLPDGNIEYLGRIDNQVKIRGFRIELGEVEAVLSQYEDVQVCCAIARVDSPGDQRLVAYVVPQSEKTLTVSELRSFLKSKLPEYMVPSAVVILESLPLTPNGKVDRRALPAPSNPNSSDTFVFPRNTIELQLVQIWSKILKVDNIGVKDNFFDLGGHSLLAPYLMTQIKQQFDKDIPLAILFQHPTIEDLASLLQKDPDASGWSPLVAIQPTGSNPPFFCLPGAGGFPFYFYNLARCLGSDQPFYSFQPQDRDGELAEIRKVEDIAAQYLKVIQSVQTQGPYFLGGHSFGGKVAFEIAQQLVRQGETVALVAMFDTIAPIAQPEMEEMDDVQWLIQTAKLFQIGFRKDLDMDVDPLLSLALDEQFKYVLDYLKILDILPPDADTTYLKRLVQAFKADGKAHDEYVPQQFNLIAITLFRASESYQEKSAALQQFEILQDLDWGWSDFSSEPLDVQFVPGNHVTMMTQPHVQVLAERLKACINKAMNKISSI